jgi:hypothetical protein
MKYKDGSLVDRLTKWQMDRNGSGLHSMAAWYLGSYYKIN